MRQDMKIFENERPLISVSQLDPNFKYEIAEQPGGENIKVCFACGTCSAGCPVREIDERYNPRKIIRMALLGMRERVLSSPFIWLCATCYTCQERCPQDVRITDLMNALRNMAVKEGYIPPAFRAQLDLIGSKGRLYEIDEFDNKKRVKMGLPPIPSNSEDVRRIMELTGVYSLFSSGQEGS